MSSRHSLVYSIFNSRCPRCREGKMFPNRSYSIRFMEMHKKCPCCRQTFVLEPGFFLGSAFFSYFINAVLLMAIALTLFYTRTKITIGWMIVAILVVVFGLLPITLRLSKSLWIHLFIRYEGPCDKIEKKD